LVAAFPALVFLAAAFLTAVLLTAVLLTVVRRFFGLVLVEFVGRGFTDRFGLAWSAERGFQIEVSSKVIVRRRRRPLFLWRTRPTTLSARRLGSTALRTSRLSTRLAARAFGGRAGRFGWRGSGLGLRRRSRRRFVQQQVFGRNLGVGCRLGPQIDAEQIFGQGFPGVVFAARAGAQRIGVHRALITID
jgi:hypothetical protein